MRFACSHLDAVLQVQQLFCFFSGKKKKKDQVSGKWPTCCFQQRPHQEKKSSIWFSSSHLWQAEAAEPESFSNMSQGWIKLQDVPLFFGAPRGLGVVFQSQDNTGRFSATPVDGKKLFCVCLLRWGCSEGEAGRTPGRTEESHGSVMRQREKKREKIDRDEKGVGLVPGTE